MDFQKLTQKELASALGYTSRTIRNLQADPSFPRNKDKTYSLPVVVEWMISQVSPGEGEKWLTQYRRERALITTLQRERLQGDLIEKDQATKWLITLVSEARAAFLALPRRLAPVLYGTQETRDIEAMLREEIRVILEKLARPITNG